jgi:hypothetical protein
MKAAFDFLGVTTVTFAFWTFPAWLPPLCFVVASPWVLLTSSKSDAQTEKQS